MSGASDTKTLRRSLLAWYRAHRRDLPWRRTRDPYAIWISEAMLQQTRVETVIPYYERFLARFPDVEQLATADVDDVLGLWTGLGYYSRARNVHRAAQAIVARHGGRVPSDPAALQELPGVGRYTAGAVASIAFDRPAPIVDGNVARVFARLFGIADDIRSTSVQRRLWEEALRLVAGEDPGALNQALMELGATHCTPRSPRCLDCPVARYCTAHAEGNAPSLPVKSPAAAPRRIEAVAAWIERGGKVLAVKRPQRGLLAGMWELPGGDLTKGEVPAESLVKWLRDRVGLRVTCGKSLGSIEHVFSHRRLRLHVFVARPLRGRVRRSHYETHRWLAPAALDALPQGGPTRKALALVRAGGPTRDSGPRSDSEALAEGQRAASSQ